LLEATAESDVKENISKTSVDLLKHPHLVAELAIKNMAEKGYWHLDIAWHCQ
jgi:hypothetical protein